MEINGKKIDMDAFCIMPFLSVNNKWSGELSPCCHYRFWDDPFFNNTNNIDINNHTFSEIFHSEYYQQIREKFLNNEKIASCNTCWEQEKVGIQSLRNHKNIIYKDFINAENILKPKIRHLELCTANLCNLACVHCWPGNSNQLEKEWNKYENIPLIDARKLSYNVSDIIEQDLYSLSPNLRRVDWSGGEPLLSDLYYKYLDYLVKNNYSKNIHLFHNSNGTVYKQEIIDNYWRHFKQIEFTVSIDGLSDKFEYMRYPGKWSNFLKNIDRYRELKDKNEFIFDLRFLITVSSLNIMHVPELVKFLKPYGEISLNFLFQPEYYAAFNLPQRIKDKINEYFSNIDDPIMNHVCCKEAIGYLNRPIELKFSNDVRGMELIERLRHQILKLDARRNNSYELTFPESYRIIFEK